MPTNPAGSPLDALLARLWSRPRSDAEAETDRGLLDAFTTLTDGEWPPHDARAALRERVARVADGITVRELPNTSNIPGGGMIHRTVGAATRRQRDAVTVSIQALAQEIRGCLLEMVDYVGTSVGHRLERIAADLEVTANAVADTEARLNGMAARLGTLEDRLAQIEAAERDRGFQPWFSELDFGEEFRGSRKQILDRYHDLADIAATHGGPILDLGCGRGELIELLLTRNVEARGVEIDPELVEFCRSVYLDVRLADAATALRAEGDGTLGGVLLIQVVEHLTAQQLVDLVPLMAQKLRPGGVVIAETVNGTSPFVLTRSFYADPTHTNPVHHEYLAFLFRKAGFRDVEVKFRSPVPDEAKLRKLTVPDEGDSDLAEGINAAFEALNQHLFGAQDYALIATR